MASLSRLGVVAGFLAVAALCLPLADLTVAGHDSWAALARMGRGFLVPDFGAIEQIARAVALTVAQFDLVASFFQLRKQIFVDRMAWPLHHAEGIEFEQYDTFDTVYVIAHRDGRAIGGARLYLLPTRMRFRPYGQAAWGVRRMKLTNGVEAEGMGPQVAVQVFGGRRPAEHHIGPGLREDGGEGHG